MSIETASRRPDPKAWATLQARACLAGLVLSRYVDDDGSEAYVITRGAWTKQLRDVDSIEAFLERATGARAA